MRILIYGAGAVGCYLGGHLALAGHEVTLLGRQPLAQAVAKDGLSLQLLTGPHHVPRIRVCTNLADALKPPAFDWIAFSMKAYDTVSAIHDLQAEGGPVPPIACFQNGVGNEESLRAAFGPDNVVAATITTPVSTPQAGLVIEEKRRGVTIAADSPAYPMVLASLGSTVLSVSVVPQSTSLKWSKLLLNMLANAIPAILDISSEAVYRDRRLFGLEMSALREAIAMVRLLGIPLVNLPGVPARLLATLTRSLPNFALQPVLRQRVASGRGDKLPSLLAALRAGNKHTEVAWLNGAVAQAARAMDRLAPINHALALTVSDIVSGREPWDSYRHNPDRLFSSIAVARGIDGWWYGE
jgi:2-dehydropantoate 2-reductase